MDEDGAVVLQQNPADALSKTQQNLGRALRQQRTLNRETMQIMKHESGIHSSDSIAAAHCPDLTSETLRTFGTLKNKKVPHIASCSCNDDVAIH